MNVLSLFDGMSCGQLALKKAGIKVNSYFASEIDKHAIEIALNNFPKTYQIGDVTKVVAKISGHLPKIDLLIGGSPCQGFSFAGKQLNFNDPRSKLFFEFIRLKEETKPKYFMLENVKMKKESQDIISNYLGVGPIEINSSLISAQNRKRYYWTNIPLKALPKARGIILADILETDRRDFHWLDKDRSDYVLSLASLPHKERKAIVKDGSPMPSNVTLTPRLGQFVYNNHLGQNGGLYKDMAATLVCAGRHHCVDELNGELRIRRLTITECERLQTVPDGYTEGVSDSQRYKMLGNGWTVDVIAHIFNGLK